MILDGDYLYYITLSPNSISKIDLNGENEVSLISREVSDFDISDDTIYFTDSYGYLCKIDLDGNDYSQLTEDSISTKFQIYNDDIYYYEEDTGLMKLDVDDLTSELVSDEVKTNIYNVTNKGIFFLDTDSMNICKISLKGKNKQEIVAVNTSNTKINVIGNEIYYLDNDSETDVKKIYRVKINGKEDNAIEY